MNTVAVSKPYQNAQAESFMKMLKTDNVYLKDYRTLEEARANIGRFLMQIYNR
jgi:transposase InsO family protein